MGARVGPARGVPQIAKGERLAQGPARGCLYALVQPVGEALKPAGLAQTGAQAHALAAQVLAQVSRQSNGSGAQQQQWQYQTKQQARTQQRQSRGTSPCQAAWQARPGPG